jgi:hypothetical protein
MNKKLYVFKCAECYKEFRTDNPEEKVCPTCYKYRQPHLKRHTKKHNKKILTFAEISHIADVYNKVNHKYLHYGDIVKLINLNPKKCICCGGKTYKNNPMCSKCEVI